jgi:aspartyl-tRNA(Asn)/glutamyl-tRNA(Gln) amidotransferase subunit A
MEAVNPVLNATIWTDRDDAMEAARAADAAVRNKAPLGLLHGVPMMHKDMYYQAGKPSTCGSALRRDWRPSVTATVIERLSGAGAYTFGGLNMAEFAQNPTGHNKTFGDCHNPWNPPYITGGSSSGSGVSVAARFNYMALGSDTGGSIRLPASANGVTGLKPTQTRVSRYGVMPLSFTHDNVGPLTRTVRDCARAMTVIAGHDPLDPTSSREPVPDYEAALTGDIRGLRIGVPTNVFFDGADAPVGAAIDRALEVLAARGATVTRLSLPLMDAVAAYGGIVSRVEAATIHAQWMRTDPQAYGAHISGRMYPGYAIPAPYYVESLSRRGPILKAFGAEVFGRVDVLVTPTIRTCLPTLEETDIDRGPPGTETKFMAVSANTRPFNYLGLPAICVPCGFDPNGCPIGLQIAGRPFAEARVMKTADAYQRDTDFHRRLPPILTGLS